MEQVCPAPGIDDPLVASLLVVVDCNVQALVYGGYSALFQPGGPFSAVLTSLMVILVALIGYQLLLGRGQLRVGDVALTAVKLGAIIALTTQWSNYQALVYAFLFDGPEQLAAAITARVRPEGGALPSEIFPALQVTFDALTGHATLFARQAPPTASPLLGGPGFGALGLTAAASILLLSSLGVLLAAKIVLGVLLAVGPIFIALLMFETTRGLFEGWLRAALAFAFAPLTIILLLAVALSMLEPSLVQLQDLQVAGRFELAPVYSILTLVLVFALVAVGVLIAGGIAAAGLKVPRARSARADAEAPVVAERASADAGDQPRAARIAAAVAALDRRDVASARNSAAAAVAGAPASSDRRIDIALDRGPRGRDTAAAAETRLGQGSRRTIRPRRARAAAPRS